MSELRPGPIHDPTAITEQSEEFWTPENQLSEMRQWRLAHDGVFKRYDIPDDYWEAEQHLEQIYRIYQADPEDNPKLLLYNFIKYLEANDRKEKVNLDFHFLSGFCGSYLEDVDFFREAGFRHASNIAIYHQADNFRRVQDIYTNHDLITADDIKRAFEVAIRNPVPYLQNLEKNIADFKDNIEPRIRQEYDLPGDWSLKFIKKIVVRHPDPYSVAKDIMRTTASLQAKYPYAKLSSLEAWSKQIVTNQPPGKARVARQLFEEIPTGLEVDEELLSKARTDLENLRQALPEGVSGSNTKTVEVQRLAMVFKLNWHESFEEIDLLDEARHLYYAVHRYNKLLGDQQSHLRISTDLENLYSVFRIFALDVSALRQEGSKFAAARVARHHPPGVYDEYKRRYKGRHPMLTDAVVAYHVANTPANIDRAIRNWIARNDKISEIAGALAIPEVD